MKSLVTFLFITFSGSVVFSQSDEAILQSKQPEKIYFKNKMIPKGVDFLDNAPELFTHSIIINAPIEKVWSVIDDTPNYYKWFPGVKYGKFVDSTDTGLGAKRIAQYKSYKYYEEIIAYEPLKIWGFTMIESSSGSCTSIVEAVLFEKIGEDQTKVIYKGGYAYKGFFNKMKGIIKKNVDKTWTNALQGLKEFIEQE